MGTGMGIGIGTGIHYFLKNLGYNTSGMRVLITY